MNIALLSTGFLGNNKEATSITLLDFAKRLIKDGNNVVVVSEKRKESLRFEKFENIQVYRVGFPYGPKRFNPLSFYNRIFAHALGVKRMRSKFGEFDVVHSFSAAPVLVLRSVFSKIFNRKAKTVHTLKSYSRKKIGGGFYKFLNYVDAVTVPTKVFAEKLVKKGVSADKIKVIRSHIDIEKFKPMDKDKLKEKYGFSGKKIVFYYGAMWEKKGTDILIKAIPEIANKDKDVIFIFAPRNLPYANKFEKMLEDSGFLDRIKMIKDDINVVEYVNMADVVALPYPSLIGTEGNPSCMLEAMACKTAVVTTDLAELREIAENSVLMAKAGDIKSLATEINKLIGDKKLRERLAGEAYEISKKFDARLITKQFLELYKGLKS